MIRLLFLLLACVAFAQDKKSSKLDITSPGSVVYTPDGKKKIEDDVRIELPGTFLITADKVIFDEKDNMVCTGNVKIDYETSMGLVEVTAAEISYSLSAQSGELRSVTARFGDAFYFFGERMEILNKGEQFLIEKGIITACNQPIPQWELKIKKATIEKEGYAVIRNAKFRVKGLPIIALPYMIIPAMQERRTGLLVPDTGRSERNGAFYSQPFYWAPRRDMDMTLTPTYYEKAGWKLDTEVRYKPTFTAEGRFQGAFYEDKALTEGSSIPLEDGDPLKKNRFRVKWNHDQNLWKGKFDIRVDAGSDFSVDRDFLRDTERTRVRDYYYQGRWDRTLGKNSLHVTVDHNERILAQNEEVIGITKLPDIRFYMPNRHIGKGFYLRNYLYSTLYELDDLGSAHQFSGKMMRLGLDSEISRAQDIGHFLHTRWGLVYNGAFYHQSDFATETMNENEGDNESVLRGSAFAFFETVGPRLQRNYSFGKKRVIHYLDAALVFRMGTEKKDPFLEDVFLDELDIRINNLKKGLQTSWRLNSRFFVGRLGKVRPVLDLEISQDVSFDENANEPSEDIDARFRLVNLMGFHGNGIFSYNPDTGTLDTISVYTSVTQGLWRGYGGYVRRRVDTTADRDSFIGISSFSLPRIRSGIRFSMDYDFERSEFKSQEFSYSYEGQCIAASLKYVKSPFDSRGNDNKDFFQLTLSLRNLGELGTKF